RRAMTLSVCCSAKGLRRVPTRISRGGNSPGGRSCGGRSLIAVSSFVAKWDLPISGAPRRVYPGVVAAQIAEQLVGDRIQEAAPLLNVDALFALPAEEHHLIPRFLRPLGT